MAVMIVPTTWPCGGQRRSWHIRLTEYLWPDNLKYGAAHTAAVQGER